MITFYRLNLAQISKFLIVTLAIFFCTCKHQPLKVERIPTTREAYYLTPEEFLILQERATKEGDYVAAGRIAQYYVLVQEDYETAMKWYEIALQLGDPHARNNLENIRQISTRQREHTQIKKNKE